MNDLKNLVWDYEAYDFFTKIDSSYGLANGL